MGMMSADDMIRSARETVAGFPPPLRAPAEAVQIRVAEWPPAAFLEPGDDPAGLTGLYEGVPLPDKSVEWPTGLDIVWLFRQPILTEWRMRGNVTLAELVAHVTIHEFAHHFGWNDAEISTIAPWQDI